MAPAGAVDLSIVIPCCDEADNVPPLAEQLLPVAAALAGRVEIVFVDDGSTDGTWDALGAAFRDEAIGGVAVVRERHGANRGLGAALRTGFAAARGEVIVTTDSDGTYPLAEIPAILACLVPGADLVTASPFHPGGGVVGVPPSRLLFSRGASAIYRALVGPSIHTYTALFRAYRRAVIERVPVRSDGHVAVVELLAGAVRAGFRVVEYPTVLRARRHGRSKATLARTTAAHLWLQAGLVAGRWRTRHAPPAPLARPHE